MIQDVHTVRFAPNAGAQESFCRSSEKYPAYIGGLGSGKTWAGSRKLVVGHGHFRGSDSLAVAPTTQNLRQITIPALTDALTEADITYHVNKSSMEILTPGLGSKILLHSGLNAERITGFEVGRTWIDEPARIPDFEEARRNVWANCVARTRDPSCPPWSWQVFLTGTHEGRGTWVYRDWEAKPKAGHVVFRGRTTENPTSIEYARILIDEYGEELAAQYVYGQAADDGGSAIPYAWILAAQSPNAVADIDWDRLRSSARPLAAGVDIGRSKSLTVAWVVEIDSGTDRPDPFRDGGRVRETLRTVAVLVLREASFRDQSAMIGRLLKLPRMRRVAIDATYNPQTAEDAGKRFGESRAVPVVFSNPEKLRLAQSLRTIVEERRLTIPEDEDIVDDWFSVKRIVKPSGIVTYSAPYRADGHADRFWAAALAIRAAKGVSFQDAGIVTGGRRRTAGLKGW